LILRKGGIAEAGGSFRVEHERFWLFPTHVHQQRGGIKPEALPLLEQAEAGRPPEGLLRLGHFAEVARVYHVSELEAVRGLDELHIWSDETVAARFAYRQPGLFVLAVRVFRAGRVHEVADLPAYAGCRSWVELERPLPTEGAVPVLDDTAFSKLLQALEQRLAPAG
jgi:hypothetical protein